MLVSTLIFPASQGGGLDVGVCAAAIDDASTVMTIDKAATRGRDTKLLVMLDLHRLRGRRVPLTRHAVALATR
jgi:hypothetical protein